MVIDVAIGLTGRRREGNLQGLKRRTKKEQRLKNRAGK